MEQFDKSSVRYTRERIDAVLEELGKELGMKFHAGNATFTENSISFKLEASRIAEDGEVVSKKAENFRLYCSRWDLTEDDLGKHFSFGGDVFKLVGSNHRATRYPMIGEDLIVCKTFKFTADAVRLGLRAYATATV